MKKILTLLPVLSLLAVGGCGGGGKDSTEAKSNSEITPISSSSTDDYTPPENDFVIPGAFLQGGYRPVTGEPIVIDESSFHVALPQNATVDVTTYYSETGTDPWVDAEEIVDEGFYQAEVTVTVGQEFQDFGVEYAIVNYEDLDAWYGQSAEVFKLFWLLDQIEDNFTVSWNYLDNYDDHDPRFHARTAWVTEEGVAYYGFNPEKGDPQSDSDYYLDTYPTALTLQNGQLEAWSNGYVAGESEIEDVYAKTTIPSDNPQLELEKFINYRYASSYDDYFGAFSLYDEGVVDAGLLTTGEGLIDLSDYQLEEDRPGIAAFLLNQVGYNDNDFFDLEDMAEFNAGTAPDLHLYIQAIEDPFGNPALVFTPEVYVLDGSFVGHAGPTYVWWMFDFVVYNVGSTEFDFAAAATGDVTKRDADVEEGGIWYRDAA